MKMKQIIILIAIVYLVQAHAQNWENSSSDTEKDSSRELSVLNCSQYASDSEVLAALPLPVPIDPFDRDIHKTYAVSYSNGTIFVSNIAYQKFVPSTIFCLLSLRYLMVRNSSFCKNEDNQSSVCQLSSDVERLALLESFNIYYTKVTHLPTSIGKLKRLKIFDLMGTDLVTLPNTFSNLQLLSSLSITYSQMTSLPTAVGLISASSHLRT